MSPWFYEISDRSVSPISCSITLLERPSLVAKCACTKLVPMEREWIYYLNISPLLAILCCSLSFYNIQGNRRTLIFLIGCYVLWSLAFPFPHRFLATVFQQEPYKDWSLFKMGQTPTVQLSKTLSSHLPGSWEGTEANSSLRAWYINRYKNGRSMLHT